MATWLKGFTKGRKGKIVRGEKGPVYTESIDYIVISTVKDEALANVLATSGLPRVNVTSTTYGAVCNSLDAKQDTKAPNVWRATAEFTTEPLNQDTGGDNPDPTTWTPIYKGTIETYPEVLYKDFSPTPKAYVNSCNNKFPEPLIINRPIIVYQFQQYIAKTISDVTIGGYNEVINSGGFKGFAAKSLKCNVSGFERGYFYGYECTLVDFKVSYKKSLWLNKPLDMGYEYRPSAGAPAMSTAGGKLVALNPNGTLRADTAEPLALEFQPYDDVPFTFLR